jgi:hypothetical protein
LEDHRLRAAAISFLRRGVRALFCHAALQPFEPPESYGCGTLLAWEFVAIARRDVDDTQRSLDLVLLRLA